MNFLSIELKIKLLSLDTFVLNQLLILIIEPLINPVRKVINRMISQLERSSEWANLREGC